MSEYNAKSIEVLEKLEGIRKNPNIYIGDINDNSYFQIIKEAIDNSIDEWLLGYNSDIYIKIDTNNMNILVADKGRGIPVETHPSTKISTLTTILTYIHAGGKFSSKNITVGTHGIGVSATNALSSIFEIWTYRPKDIKENIWYYQKFLKGIPVTKVINNKTIPIIWPSGTIIRFVPDKEIFIENYKFPINKIRNWLNAIKYLCPNLKITLDINNSKEIYKSDVGISQCVHDIINSKKLEFIGNSFEYIDNEIQIALVWTNYEEEIIQTYVNYCSTPDNGSHFNGFKKALSKSLETFSDEKYNRDDLRSGLVGIINFKTKKPTYTTQTKDKLSSKHAENRVYDILSPPLTIFFQQNIKLANLIIDKAIKLKKIKDKFKEEKNAVKNISLVSKRSKHVLPEILLGAPRCKPENRELFICEGKSAQGTLKNARDPSFQEVLPLTGKFTNAIKYPPSKVFLNENIRNIFISIGSNQNTKNMVECNPEKARVGKIILLPDQDEDGKHIRCLLISLIIRYMKELIVNGMVYVVKAPLYVTSYKDRKIFGNSLKDIRDKIPQKAKIHITRMKGWGECASSDLKTIAMNPKTRILYKVILTDQCEDKIEELMGINNLYRKKLLGL